MLISRIFPYFFLQKIVQMIWRIFSYFYLKKKSLFCSIHVDLTNLLLFL